MATTGLDLLLVHGKEKISVHLDIANSSFEEDHLTVNHLAKEVERVTKIAPKAQRLIHRGKTLFKTFDPDCPSLKETLASLGISNGARIMVLGKPNVPDSKTFEEEKKRDDLIKVLDDHQIKINEICMLCASTVETISKDHGSIEEWRKHQKFFLAQSEVSMKELTLLDATPGGVSDNYRVKRKALVNQLLSNVSLCDQQVEKLQGSIERWEKQHGGSNRGAS